VWGAEGASVCALSLVLPVVLVGFGGVDCFLSVLLLFWLKI